MRKHFALALVVALAASSILLDSCKKVIKNEAYFAAISKYIYAYTSGAIGRNDEVRVRFVNAAVGSDQIGQKVSGDLFSVSPKINGDAVWEDDRTIVLRHAEPLPYGEKYEGKIALRKLYPDAPAEAKTFEFAFSVRELSFEVIVEGVRAADLNDLKKQQIVGRVMTSDAVDNAALEKIVAASQGNKELKINWSHTGDGRGHTFVVDAVERGNVRSKVLIAWHGKALGTAAAGQQEVTVPALDEFSVLSARVEQTEEQYILLNFSDPISTSQTLDGLIRLDGFQGTLRFAVDGNFVRVYPSGRVTGWHNLRIEPGIRNVAGAAMKERFDQNLAFEDMKPNLRLVGRGAIIPKNESGRVVFPFEAVGLTAVDVEVFKIFHNNILQFLQVNEIEGSSELERVGKIILQKKVSLSELNPGANTRVWQRYAIDLQDIVAQDPGAIYQVRLAFRRGYSTYDCQNSVQTLAQNSGDEEEGDGGEDEDGGPNPGNSSDGATAFAQDTDDALFHLGQPDENGVLSSIMGGYRGIYWPESYDWHDEGEPYQWQNRDNPCAKEYYNREHFVSRNCFVSDLGITAKRGRDGSAFVAVTDLHSTEPVSGVDLEFFNFQMQPVLKTETDGTGTMRIENFREAPFFLVASRGERKGYLRLNDGGTLSLSRFDVAGVEPQKGLKGFLYGERGVWRPGDSLFLNFVLEDLSGKLPENHPITFELTDPKGSLQQRFVSAKSTGGVYAMHTATRPDAPTGNWTAKIMVGGATFTEQLKIETVKPNKLKINMDFGRKALSKGDENLSGKLSSTWLHGATARNLKAKVELQVRAGKTEFPNFKDFKFEDPARSFSSEPQVIFDGQLDGNGQASVPLHLSTQTPAPGKLIAAFKTRIFEQSGDFSTDNFALDYYPYEAFVGISIPQDRWGNKEVNREKGSDVQFACVDINGKPLSNRKLEVGLYRCDWRWWWDTDGYDNVAQFNSATHVNALERATLTTDAKGIAIWKVKPTNWGRFLVRVSDFGSPDGLGHCAGDFFWSGYPDDLDNSGGRNAAAMLPFSADKMKYAAGEEVTLKVPASENGRILVTLETGNRVIDHFWREAKQGDNLLKFRTEDVMAPTVYAHISLFQPHAQTKNDLPIRMYGVLPIAVENPASHLEPQLSMPDVIKPGDNFSVSVSEKSGKACAYTIALVDEGLLDLTRFQTPNPWDAFYAREALGVKTWDMYDFVLGAYGAELERILAIGGDEFNQKAKAGAQVSRFKPAVRHIGPFFLQKGKTAKHDLKIENYVGSVRAMVVASAPKSGARGAYGMAEKTVPVRQALMVQPTLPRVLGPGETLRLPVNVFAMENKVKNASVSVRESSGLVNVSGSDKSLSFSAPGEQMAFFDLKVGNRVGPAKFKITASGAGETASEEIEIMVRNPNPPVTAVLEGVVEPGQTWQQAVNVNQFTDLKNAVVEISSIPPLNLSKQLDYLIQYPHGCVEQTTSGAFPQLYVDLIMPLDQKQQADIQRNVSAAISKLQNFQTPTGGFGYWPGDYVPDDWASSYAGHFLVEAKNRGFAVPQQMLDRWIDYQTKTSKTWDVQSKDPNDWHYHDAEMSQAYRSYTLALAGKPDLGSMNRLREKANIYDGSASLLSAAYALAGKAEVARELMTKTSVRQWRYEWYGHTYGSDLRELALRLETWTAIGDQNRATQTATEVAQQIGRADRGGWFSTQELATCLRAISKYAQKNGFGEKGSFAVKLGRGDFKNASNDKPIYVANFTENAAGGVSIRNSGKGKLFARVILTGSPVIDNQAVIANNIALSVRYTDTKGNPVDVAKLTQGTDFLAEVTVSRTGDLWFDFTELALTQIFPSGWEIANTRMNGIGTGASDPIDYQDFRDDRVMTYFDLPAQWQQNQAKKRTYRIQLTAAYAGRYYLPTVGCEAMYDNRISAAVPGRWVEVI